MTHSFPQSPDDDREIVNEVVQILQRITHLARFLPRLKEICEDENHPLFVSHSHAVSEYTKNHMKQMRKAQVGALIQVIRIIGKTQQATQEKAPIIHSLDKENAINESMKRAGFDISAEDDKGQVS